MLVKHVNSKFKVIIQNNILSLAHISYEIILKKQNRKARRKKITFDDKITNVTIDRNYLTSTPDTKLQSWLWE